MISLDGKNEIWRPQERQALALSCPVDELLYGGSKGGGKSDYILAAPGEQIALCHAKRKATGMRQRGRAILFRKNLKNLDDLIQRSHELFPAMDPDMETTQGCGWFKIEKRWVFTSGYRFDFAHLDGPDDHTAYHGQEITALLFDQVEEIPFDVYQYLTANVRSKDADMRKLLMVRCTANPGGKYAQWVKDYFIAPCRAGNKIIEETRKLPSGRTHTITRAFIPAKLQDNKYLFEDPQYEAQIAKLPEHMRRMYLDGDWDVVIGSFFSGVWDASKHVIKSFSIPPTWEVKFGMDWGTVAPAAVLFGARDNDGNVYIIDEIYRPGETGRKFGEHFIKKVSAQRWSTEKKWGIEDFYGLLDYEAWAKRGEEGPTAGLSMQNMGIRLFKANKNRAAGIEQCLERLSLEDGKPKLYIFGDRCPNLVRTLPALRADPRNPNDVDTDDEDHLFDALKYLLLDWPVAGKEKDKNGDKDVERWLALARSRDQVRRDESSTGYA